MDFLYLLESIRTPVLDEIMLLLTQFGEETAFLVLALVLFWCVDKRVGYYTLAVGFVGTLANQFMKLWFRIPRPWVIDPEFTILEQARDAASGYSFPSGHTQSAVGTFGALAYVTKKNSVRIPAILIALIVPFSRMYIGVHTPLDVVVAALLAVALILVLKPVAFSPRKWALPALLGAMSVMAVGFLCFVEFFPFPADIDPHNLTSGIKNAYTLLGALTGLIAVYIVDEKWQKFSTKAVWWAQILKVLGGLLLVLAVKSGMKVPLNALFGESVGRAARYFLIVIAAGIVWPATFRWFSKIGNKE